MEALKERVRRRWSVSFCFLVASCLTSVALLPLEPDLVQVHWGGPDDRPEYSPLLTNLALPLVALLVGALLTVGRRRPLGYDYTGVFVAFLAALVIGLAAANLVV